MKSDLKKKLVRPISAQMCPKWAQIDQKCVFSTFFPDQVTVQKLGFCLFFKILALDFLILDPRREGPMK